MMKYTDDDMRISSASLVMTFLMANIYRHQIQVSQNLACVFMVLYLILMGQNVDETEC